MEKRVTEKKMECDRGRENMRDMYRERQKEIEIGKRGKERGAICIK